MSPQLRSVFIIATVLALVGSVAYIRSHRKIQERNENESRGSSVGVAATRPAEMATRPAEDNAGALPRVVDLGATWCIPCKKMAPILEELKTELAGKAIVEFIDISADKKAGQKYGIRVMPTQVFFGLNGKEVWRHEGFIPKEEIIAKLRDAGMK